MYLLLAAGEDVAPVLRRGQMPGLPMTTLDGDLLFFFSVFSQFARAILKNRGLLGVSKAQGVRNDGPVSCPSVL